MNPTRRLIGIALLTAGIAAIAALTLDPRSVAPSADEPSAWRFVASEKWLADIIANALLYVPLGAGAFLLWKRVGVAVGIALATTLAVEIAQWIVPGRQPSLIDPPANVLGAFLGHGLAQQLRADLRLRTRPSERLTVLISIAFSAVAFGTSFLLVPSLPRSIYYGQWTPDLAHLGHYGGSVESARVGDAEVGSGPFEFPDQLRRLLNEGGPVVVDANAGPPPSTTAPIFSIYDDGQREIFLLGADGTDLVVRHRRRANDFAFDRPDLRVHDAFAETADTEPIRVTAGRDGARSCLGVDDVIECDIGHTAGRGWALLYYPEGLSRFTLWILDALWIGSLLAPVGFYARRTLLSYVGLAICLLALLCSPLPGVLLLPGASVWLGASASLSGVAWLRHRYALARRARRR